MLSLDSDLLKQYKLITGIDEAGRGPLAGPLVVCAVTIDKDFILEGVNDSKKLTDKKRRSLVEEIHDKAIEVNTIIISEDRIDEINILAATMEGMEKVCLGLEQTGKILIDGNRIPDKLKDKDAEYVIKGDGKVSAIAAASIIAKVTRDDIMLQLDKLHPEYRFSSNKGYGTKEHLEAIRKYGVTRYHRKSYKPVSQLEFKF